MSALIEAHELSKRFESRGVVTAVLDAVELAIEAGEFVAIMGLSGSGKSTLLQILAGLTSPTAGEVYFGGERTDTLSETEQALHRREHVGCMFQFFGLIDDLTAAENIELPARIAGTELEAAEDRREELMTRLGIADRAGAYPYQLSGGYQQRVALARALMNQPRVLFADEPTGNLDSEATAETLALLGEAHAAGQTLLLVTHDWRVASAADRVLRLRNGRIASETRLEAQADPERRLAELIRLDLSSSPSGAPASG